MQITYLIFSLLLISTSVLAVDNNDAPPLIKLKPIERSIENIGELNLPLPPVNTTHQHNHILYLSNKNSSGTLQTNPFTNNKPQQ
ncbi:hypothetical protein A3F06_00255 [candidate division TM6 bacterium RIFCSPHIGHO2_12_FULL_36_22]|nr:MAG: hypothetical protein A3F06_00255 [candidate division TM6 bacterium RIFCSPHIGHO2_12_FULL_36_22]